MKNALSLPISGLNGRIVRDLYDECERRLPNVFPKLNVCFIGTPFPRAPFPLLNLKHICRNPEEQVLRSWSRLVGFGIDTLKPAQQEADIVICRRLGLDVLMLAAACEKWQSQGKRATEIHHGLVRRHLVGTFGIRIPDAYILPQLENGAAERVLLETFPGLENIRRETLHRFLEAQKCIVNDYFSDSTGQNDPLRLDASRPVSEMFDHVVDFVKRQLEARRR